MKRISLKGKTKEELLSIHIELKESYDRLKTLHFGASSSLENPSEIKMTRRNIARVLTQLNKAKD